MKQNGQPKKQRALNITVFVINLLVLLAVVWIIVPAPSYYVWLFSVAASEWSLIFGFVALLGIFCALIARFISGGKFWLASFTIGAIAFFISLYPFFSAYRLAGQQNISLSWREYFAIDAGDTLSIYTTRTFANIDGVELKTDVYSPPYGIQKNGAAIIVVHGGSWNGGKRNDFPQWNRWLSENGYTVFDVDYRLTPPNWRTATGDIKCAAGWVEHNAAEFGISPDKIVLMGRSAGAHLALLAAYSKDKPQLPPSCAAESQIKIRVVVSLYAPTDLIWDYDNPANQNVIDGPETLRRFVGGNPSESVETRNNFITASPVNYVSVNTPPTLLIHGGRDQLVLPQNMEFLAAKLNKNGVANQEILIPYAQHGFDFNFNGWGSQIIKPKMLEFLRANTK